jgi:hypothetical protein
LSARYGPPGLHFQHAPAFGFRFQEVVSIRTGKLGNPPTTRTGSLRA